MKQSFLKYKKLIIVFSCFFIPLMFISFFKVNYSLTAPGYNDEVGKFIEIENGYSSSGSFHTTSVISLDGISIFQYLLGSIEKKVEVTPFPTYYENINISDLVVMSYLMKDDSLNTSLIVAISIAGFQIDYETHKTVYLTWNYLDENTLEIGDKILDTKVNDVSVSIQDILCGDIVEFTVLRGTEIITMNVTKKQVSETVCSLGVSLYDFSEIDSTEVNYNLVDTLTGGPSGGLLQTLYIYNLLSSVDISRGLKIAGTGTIDVNGNVGAIGGVEQKIYTSAMNNIDIFFVPYASNNYEDALAVYNTIDTDMILVGVNTFSDAIIFLLTYEGGEPLE